MKLLRKIFGIICLIETFFGVFLLFTEFKDEPIVAIYLIGLFGFFTYLLLWKKPKKYCQKNPAY